MAIKIKNVNGEFSVTGLDQDHINGIVFALEQSSEFDEVYDELVHEELEFAFSDLYMEVEEEESGPEDYSGYLTSASARAIEESNVVLSMSDYLERDRQAHGYTEDE